MVEINSALKVNHNTAYSSEAPPHSESELNFNILYSVSIHCIHNNEAHFKKYSPSLTPESVMYW